MNVNSINGGTNCNFKAGIHTDALEKMVTCAKAENQLGELINVEKVIKDFSSRALFIDYHKGLDRFIYTDTTMPGFAISLKGKNLMEQILGINKESMKVAQESLLSKEQGAFEIFA